MRVYRSPHAEGEDACWGVPGRWRRDARLRVRGRCCWMHGSCNMFVFMEDCGCVSGGDREGLLFYEGGFGFAVVCSLRIVMNSCAGFGDIRGWGVGSWVACWVLCRSLFLLGWGARMTFGFGIARSAFQVSSWMSWCGDLVTLRAAISTSISWW